MSPFDSPKNTFHCLMKACSRIGMTMSSILWVFDYSFGWVIW